jgi:type IV pilus assembly protein PilA
MVVLVILGIVAMIAIPAYDAYIVRAKVSNELSVVDSLKQAVAELRMTDGNFQSLLPDDTAQTFTNLGINDPTLISPAISEILFTKADDFHMSIVICGATIGQGTSDDSQTVDLFITGNVYSGGMKWGCMYNGNSNYVPESCRTLYDAGVYGALPTACARVAPQPPT